MQVDTLVVGALQTNCYLVYDEDTKHALVIDPGDEAARILRAVSDKELSVTAVVLTHVHYDHIMAAAEICAVLSAPLCVGADDVSALTDDRSSLVAYFAPERHIQLSADRVLCDGDVLSFGGESLTVWHTPGHTRGSICLLGDDILIAGDTLFCGGVGRTDFPGGDTAALHRSLQRLMQIEGDRRVYCGHDISTTLAYERQTNPFINHG